MPFEDVTYDFERDEWVAHRLIQARWIDQELPMPAVSPAVGKWTAQPTRPFSRSFRYFPLVAAGIFFLGFATQAAGVPGFVAGLFFAAIFFVVLSAVTHPIEPKATDRDRQLIEDPDDLDVCLVQATIYRHGVLVGSDRGAVWFDRGRLLFNGARTSFAIGGEDVLPRRLWKQFGDFERGLSIPLRVGGQAHVQFCPLRTGGLVTENEERFVIRFGAFCRRPPLSKGPRQWPPFE